MDQLSDNYFNFFSLQGSLGCTSEDLGTDTKAELDDDEMKMVRRIEEMLGRSWMFGPTQDYTNILLASSSNSSFGNLTMAEKELSREIDQLHQHLFSDRSVWPLRVQSVPRATKTFT